MSIHEHLPPEVKRELKQVGWSKGLELAKVARRRDGQDFDCATWLHKARELPKEQFRREVEKELTEATLRVLPSFHFPTANKARDKIVELRRLIEVDLLVVKVSKRRDSVSLCSAA